MSATPPFVDRAKLVVIKSDGSEGRSVYVHFNPSSLVHSVENSVAQQSSSPSKTQYSGKFSAKLTMELQFDTTDVGYDVRYDTNKVGLFMQADDGKTTAGASASPPSAKANSKAPAKAPPILQFQWGSYFFQGIMDSFKETIDFFSAEGVALRALVSIGLSRQDKVFDDSSLSRNSHVGSVVPTSDNESLAALVARGNDPSAARTLGTSNGLDSLRFTGGVPLQVNPGVQLNPPSAFATPSSSLSAGGSAGLSFSAGSGLGAAFGASASAGVPATAGAFAGLQSGVATVSSTANLDLSKMIPATVATDVSTFPGASFSIGGAANNVGSAGLSSDVGASYGNRLTFSSSN